MSESNDLVGDPAREAPRSSPDPESGSSAGPGGPPVDPSPGGLRARVLRVLDLPRAGILVERYLLLLVAEPPYLLLLLAQAPFIAGMIVLAWKDAKESPTLFLFLCLAALWVGCVNACREIVKERPIYQRERRSGVGCVPYLISKLLVLGGLDLIGCVLMVTIVHYWVGLSGSPWLIALALWATAMAGTTLGLAVSAFVTSSDKAVGLVPLVILPQILFTRPFLPMEPVSGVAARLEDLTLLGWGFELYEQVRVLGFDPHWKDLAECVLALSGLSGGLVLLTLMLLARDGD